MGSPNYVTLITTVVEALQGYTALTDLVPSGNMHYGGPEQQSFLTFPSITVELLEAMESDVGMPARKEMSANFVITAYESSPDYLTGIQNVQKIVRQIDNALQAGYTVGGQAIYSQVLNRRFFPGEYETTPIMACRLNYNARVRFVRAT
jgi:hypothetical protein